MTVRVVAILCAAEVLSMAGFSTYPALLPALRSAWNMSNTEAGLVGGAFFGGYMVAVPVLVGLTDRLPPRRIYVAGCLLLALGAAGFAELAAGVWTAAAMQVVCGAGLAGTYMPGLRELSDRIQGPRQGRAIAFYTSTFGIGTSLSLVLAGAASEAFGWRTTFLIAAAGPVCAALLVATALPPSPAPRTAAAAARRLFDFAPVYRNRPAMGIIAGYSAHCWELFALRSWMVAFFAFLAARGGWGLPWGAAAVAAVINLLGPPSSILGNEAAAGARRKTIVTVMCGSALFACVAGTSAWLPTLVAVAAIAIYFVAIMGDSAALTAGLVEAVPPAARGGAMALHSLGGFAAGLAAPLAFGALLDLGGGDTHPGAWTISFVSLAFISLCGALAVHGWGFRHRSRC